ncbi:MAG: hypothetical protein WBC19_00615 [Pyrinomonadaceae bacterium]|nr:hypothetical protein [Pyrinomonadaceae bacterium]
MSIVEIEAAISKLPLSEVSALMTWLENHQERLWDEQIAKDADAGKLDMILERAKRDSDAGLGTPL